MQLLFGWLSQIILALALPYFVISMLLGIRVAHRNGLRLDSQESTPESLAAGICHDELYFLVPCLNEEVVIGATVRRLLAEPGCTVIVIDDGSSDHTAERARSAAAACGQPGRLVVLTRSGAQSQLGKGAALNAAFPLVVQDVKTRGLDPNDVIVGVMDADGRLSAGAVDAALKLFSSARIGGVQLIVRIRDRHKLLAQFQDIEFWMISALSQFARSISGTVSLGGNGQFTRLSALQELDGDPWSWSLTEDLDLGLRLITAGWQVTTTTHSYVDQQAVDTFARLLRQRTRWYQGHMDSMRRLPDLWRSNNVNEVAILEVTSYLLVPWLIVLPWSILQQWIIYQLLAGSGHGIFATGLGSLPWRATYGLLWYVLSFAPNLLIGFIYARRTHAVTMRRALVLGHLMIAWNYVGYFAAWRAVSRMLRGRTNWTKTTRSSEVPEPTLDHAPAVIHTPVLGWAMPQSLPAAGHMGSWPNGLVQPVGHLAASRYVCDDQRAVRRLRIGGGGRGRLVNDRTHASRQSRDDQSAIHRLRTGGSARGRLVNDRTGTGAAERAPTVRTAHLPRTHALPTRPPRATYTDETRRRALPMDERVPAS